MKPLIAFNCDYRLVELSQKFRRDTSVRASFDDGIGFHFNEQSTAKFSTQCLAIECAAPRMEVMVSTYLVVQPATASLREEIETTGDHALGKIFMSG